MFCLLNNFRTNYRIIETDLWNEQKCTKAFLEATRIPAHFNLKTPTRQECLVIYRRYITVQRSPFKYAKLGLKEQVLFWLTSAGNKLSSKLERVLLDGLATTCYVCHTSQNQAQITHVLKFYIACVFFAFTNKY